MVEIILFLINSSILSRKQFRGHFPKFFTLLLKHAQFSSKPFFLIFRCLLFKTFLFTLARPALVTLEHSNPILLSHFILDHNCLHSTLSLRVIFSVVFLLCLTLFSVSVSVCVNSIPHPLPHSLNCKFCEVRVAT